MTFSNNKGQVDEELRPDNYVRSNHTRVDLNIHVDYHDDDDEDDEDGEDNVDDDDDDEKGGGEEW